MTQQKITADISVSLGDTLKDWLKGKLPLSLREMLKSAKFDHLTDDIKTMIVSALARRVAAQSLRTFGAQMGHILVKQIDGTIDNPQMTQMTLPEKRHIADLLTANMVYQLVQAASLLTQYPAFQEAVVECKEHPIAGHDEDLTNARHLRDAAANVIKEAFVNLGRVIAGDHPHNVSSALDEPVAVMHVLAPPPAVVVTAVTPTS